MLYSTCISSVTATVIKFKCGVPLPRYYSRLWEVTKLYSNAFISPEWYRLEWARFEKLKGPHVLFTVASPMVLHGEYEAGTKPAPSN